jgi:hypothetical protein
MNNCDNCGKEFVGEGHCQDCKIAHLSLEVEKYKKEKRGIFKWFVVSLMVLVVLVGYLIMRM